MKASGSLCMNLFNSDTSLQKKFLKNTKSTKLATNLPLMGMLSAINQFCSEASNNKSAIMIAHSAISSESFHLTSAMIEHYRALQMQTTGTRHSPIVGYIDTLLLFRRLYPNLNCYTQSSLVKHFFGIKYRAHNALDDSLMLYSLWHKYLWPKLNYNFDILSEASVSNLYCVDRFLEKEAKNNWIISLNPKSLKKQFQLTKEICKEIDEITIKVYKTEHLLEILYPNILQDVFKQS